MLKILVINLDRSPERWAAIAKQFEAWNLPEVPVECFPAVDGTDPAQLAPYISLVSQRRAKLVKARPLTPTQIGCYASHYEAWKHCFQCDHPAVIIEDDALIAADQLERFVTASTHFPQWLDCVRLSTNHTKKAKFEQVYEAVDFSVMRFTKAHMTTVGYYLSPNGARKLLAKSKPWYLPVDLYMGEFWRHGVQCFGVCPTALEPNPMLDTTRVTRSRKPINWLYASTKILYSAARCTKRELTNWLQTRAANTGRG